MDARVIELSAQNSALIIVDMQAEGCERHGAGVKPVIQNIKALLDRFRRVGGKIIHVQSVRTSDHPEFTFFGKAYSLIENSPAVEFVDDLRPLADEPVIKKYSHDCFYQTSDGRAVGKIRSAPVPGPHRGERNRLEQLRLSCGDGISHQKLYRSRPGGLYSCQPARRTAICAHSIPFARIQFQRQRDALRQPQARLRAQEGRS